MLTKFFNITVIAEWFTLFAAIILLNKQTGVWRLFIPFMFLTVCTEFIGSYESVILKIKNNSMIFNFNLIISVSFFIYLFSQVDTFKKNKRILIFILFGFIGLAFMNVFFFQGIWIYNSYTETLGDILLALLSCYFYYSLLKEDEFRNLFKDEYFWLATGLFFSSMGSVILYIFLNQLQSFNDKNHINVYGYINYGINLLLYSNLIIAFICRRRNTKLLQVL